MERTLVLYHGSCPDGFGGAYSAWKKLGDSAEYIPLHRGDEAPDVTGAHVYLIDFTYPQDIMDAIRAQAASLVVLDHHVGVQEVIESMPEYVFDKSRSGATIAWNYFHPDVPTPFFLKMLEDADNFYYKLPDTTALHTYLEVRDWTFEDWDEIVQKIEDPKTRDEFFGKARIYAEYFQLLVEVAVKKAKKVSFEGYTCLFASCHPLKTLKSQVGHALADALPPISLTVTAHPNGYGVSIRGDGTVDVAELASRHGGNGHFSSAGFLIPREGPFPWTLIKDDEDTSN